MNLRRALRISGTARNPLIERERAQFKSLFPILMIVAVLVLCPVAGQAQTVSATIPVGGLPAALAVNPVTNKVYVAGGSIFVIDGATHTFTSINAGGEAIAVAVNPVTNKIYFADIASNPGRVIVIDGATNAITSVVDPNANEPVALALNPVTNKIYVANGLSNNVTVIDGATNTTTTVTAGNIPFAVGVNPVTNKIYIANQASPVTVIDGNTNRTTSIGTGGTDVAVNPVTNKVYVPNYNNPGTVTVIDGANNSTTTVSAGFNARFAAVNTLTNKIYVANQDDNTVTIIDGATNATATVNAGTRPSAIAVNSATNTIYVANAGSNNVTIIDGATNSASTATDANANSPDGIATNPVTNKIFVANSRSGSVTVIDGAMNSTATVSTENRPLAVALNPVSNKIYVGTTANNAFSDSSVMVIDGATNSSNTVAAGAAPSAMAVNLLTNKIYAANIFSNNVTVIDGMTSSTSTIAAGRQPAAVDVNPITNKIYVSNNLDNSVTVIDGATDETTTVAVGGLPIGIAVNPVTNKIYVANNGESSVTVIDGETNSTSTIAVSPSPSAVAVNPVTNKVYVGSNLGNSNTMTVIDGTTNSTGTITTGMTPNAIVVNPYTNIIYVANSSSNTMTVVDGTTNLTTTLAVGPFPNALALNPVTNKIYVTNSGDTSVTVIDGVSNTATTVAAGNNPSSVAVNSVTGKIYVANKGGTDVTVITESKAQPNPNPLTTAITPLSGNTTTNAKLAFQFEAANSAPPPVTNLFFQFDTFEEAWNRGTAGTKAGSFTGTSSGLTVGTHILYAYATDGEEATSVMRASSPAIGGIAAYVFGELGISTNATLTANVNPAVLGQQVTFTADIFGATTGTPVGSVSFFDGSTFLGNAAIDSTGHAAFQTNSLALGGHSISAAYIPSPSAGFAASTSAVLDEHILLPTSTALASSALTTYTGQQVTFTATVSTSASGTPAGTVGFFDGMTQIGTGALDANGQTAFSTSTLAAGTHLITAEYAGDTNYIASTSTPITKTIYAQPDFSIAAGAGSSTSATVKAGLTAMYSLQLSLVGGAPSDQLSILVSCAGAPVKSVCTGPSEPVMVTSAAPATVAISISTTANGLATPSSPSTPRSFPLNRLLIPWMVLILFSLLLGRRIAGRFAGEVGPVRAAAFATSVLVLTMSIFTINGCGGGPSTPPPVNNGTPVGTYTITVSLTATSTSGNVSHSQPLTLTVK